jgi:putative hemolysin
MTSPLSSAEIPGLLQAGVVSHLTVRLAHTSHEIEEALRLRYRIFAEEYGAELETKAPGIDVDEFDAHCHHLIVTDDDRLETVGTYRMLLPEQALRAGRYYSQGEFDLANLLGMGVRILEVGRSCVHADYRHGAVIALLWSGIGAFLQQNKIDFVMGCSSVHDEDGGRIGALYRRIAERHLAPADQRVIPLTPLPGFDPQSAAEPAEMPPLLKGYLRAGAMIGGDPCWDPAFHCADFFIWLPARGIAPRYSRRFYETPRALG